MFQRGNIVAGIEHKRAAGTTAVGAVMDYVRDAAFTTLNRFVALKMLEACELVQECITKGEQSAGFREFCGMAPGLALLSDAAGYRLYVECLFDEFSTEIKVLFDRRDAASVLWPKRQTFEALLSILNAPDLSGVWGEDETIGWVYQFFNSGEERKKMREESQAPRNSRELAVRNQFFTPRYVVQFLVDNTLGRLWLEMNDEPTRITELCKYLVRSADEPAQPRPRKDPRDLRILDPACGSGHFLLYSFDVLLAIYEEAWSAEGTAPSDATGRSLREDYSDITDLRRAAPRLIVEHNLYGVDIDPRCAQIAALALWLRAQRAWKDLGITASGRPRIQRTHIVVAESMPGDSALVDEFAARLDPPLLRDLFKKMVDESRLAGELGTLLRIEDGIAADLHHAREQFVKQRETAGFLPGLEPIARQGALDLSGIDDDSFFHEAEARIVEGLRAFADTASGSANVRRRLFAGDAAQGVALIDLVRTQFDVVLMNPPFGAATNSTKSLLAAWYPDNGGDILTAFICRSLQLGAGGYVAGIFSRAPFFLPNYAKWRSKYLLSHHSLRAICDMGADVLDGALVEAFCVVLGARGSKSVPAFRLTRSSADSKKQVLLTAISDAIRGRTSRVSFVVNTDDIAAIPGCPIVYSAAKELRELSETGRSLGQDLAFVEQGLSTKNDFRYLRLAVEIPDAHRDVAKWAWIAKGGEYRPFFDDLHLVVKAHDQFRELSADLIAKYPYLKGNPAWVLHPEAHYLRGGITYPERTTSAFGPRCLPEGCYFSHVGLAIVPRDHSVDAATLLAWLMSRPSQLQVELQVGSAESAARHYSLAVVGAIRFPNAVLKSDYREQVNTICSRLQETSRRSELSVLFVSPLHGTTSRTIQGVIAELYRQHEARCVDALNLFAECAESIERAFALDSVLLDEEVGQRIWTLPHRDVLPEELATLLEISDEDLVRTAVTQLGAHRAHSKKAFLVDRRLELIAMILGAHPAAITRCREDNLPPPRHFAQGVAGVLVSYLVGVAFGRFNPHEPLKRITDCDNPFLPLPSRAPASNDAIKDRWDVLVDDPGHPHDLLTQCAKAFENLSFDEREWSVLWRELATDENGARDWLAKNFFQEHLSRYSAFRRKAPLYMQIGVPSGRYSVWLYLHAVTSDTLYKVQNDVVARKLAHEERLLEALRGELGTSVKATDRRQLATQESFVEELRAFLDEVKRAAPIWNPNLDDGAIITFAPLWRLVPHHKAWQSELMATWDSLRAEEYDWAHLAMHLWPERVVAKCATDRSLAIAHGLEDVFWIDSGAGEWKSRPTPTRPVDELVRERSSIAVKAALKSLLEGPVANANGGRGRGGRVVTVAPAVGAF
jgi:hypothetical protein